MVLGAAGVWLGFPLADPVVGLVITVAIFGIVWQSSKAVLTRMLDGVDPTLVDEIRHGAARIQGVTQVLGAKARWLGHRLYAELNIAVDPELTIAQAHAVAAEVRHQLLHRLEFSLVVIHVDPADQSGEAHHRISEHAHDGLPAHSHG